MKNKSTLTMIIAFLMAMAMNITAFAGVSNDGAHGDWHKDDTGWRWQNEDGTWANTGWLWLDGNEDGIAECYFFDSNGYILANTTTSDGYIVNNDGAWIENGVIQTKNKQETSNTNLNVTMEDDVYNKDGVNKIAMEMIVQTREENAKYGEVSETLLWGYKLIINYKNGFEVTYLSSYPSAWSLMVDPSRTDLDHKFLLKFYYPNHQSYNDRVADTIEKDALLRGMGFDMVSSFPEIADSVWWKIKAGDTTLRMRWFCTDKVFLYNDVKDIRAK